MLRESLIRLLEEANTDPSFRPGNGESLIRSGRIDSLGLFQLALWIEEKTHTKLDLTVLDPATDWDTVTDILDFVEKHDVSGGG
jgi:acyl carrier protein